MASVPLSIVRPDGDTEQRTVDVERIANCGYTGRDEAEVRAHVEELAAEGIPAPDTIPAIYPKPSHLVTTGEAIEVMSPRTSGEAEFVLFPTDGATYVGVGSDHTDRALEREDIPLSKTVCPNVLGERVWRLSDVADHWDRIELRSWTGGRDAPYQDATLAAIKPPSELLSLVADRSTAPLEHTAVFSGSVGTETGDLVYGDTFSVELHDPVLERTLAVEYDVTVVDWLVGDP